MSNNIIASVVLNDMNRTTEASYGFRSWILQNMDQPYEVVLNLFNNKKNFFVDMYKGSNPNCNLIINEYPASSFFNISAANNLGLHHSHGKYIYFANSDMIYPANYLRLVTNELCSHSISYILGSRVNLDKQQTSQLLDPSHYVLEKGFNDFINSLNLVESRIQRGLSPWIIERSVAEAIGGFDPKVLCHEDADFNERTMHYLRRKGLQSLLFSINGIYGFHLHHAPSELYNVSSASRRIVEDRIKLLLDPLSTADIMPTKINDLRSLIEDLNNTPNEPEVKEIRPTLKFLQRLVKKIIYRIRLAFKAITEG